ncbi:class I SAM-dependent methyltransferase [Baekduia soli]|uniref:Class I SAM-dependent methyltransferase n=1 Tax=Baekduia soli TaxID=496014 RepID=A0A5B8U7C2_9ACTN|nr:class I SAM-dependent methyltransferase [Baekduia soli]QEC48841.1 class I SAM-dependent methyltransferase [Baekduia soli]
MTDRDPERPIDRLVAGALEAGEPTGWFEPLYAAAREGEADVPWDHGAPRPRLVEWTQERAPRGEGRRAVVVGCGLGSDAEFVAGLGFDTVAFDIAPSAVRGARDRHPDSPVRYVVADLLAPPPDWAQAFDLVVESLTVQSLPDPPRAQAIASVAGLIAPGGTLVVVASARDAADGPVAGPPWPLTRAEVDAFATGGVQAVEIRELRDDAPAGHRWWRAEFLRPAA